MNETRILIPYEEKSLVRDLSERIWVKETYDDFVEDYTRPLRGWGEWTEEEQLQMSAQAAQTRSRCRYIVEKVFDIATRPAPVKHKPCPFCGSMGRQYERMGDMAYKFFISCKNCDSKTGMFQTTEEAWAAWDKRA